MISNSFGDGRQSNSRTRKAVVLCLLLVGTVVGCFALYLIPYQRLAAGITVAAATSMFVGNFGVKVGKAIERLRHPSPRATLLTGLAVTLASGVILLGSVYLDGRELFPKLHDEHSYILQTRMLAAGKLWMPPHPLEEALQSFHILLRPVYTSIYFPGTALLNVPMVWLHLPYWLIPLVLSSLTVGLVYWNLRRLADGYVAAGSVVLLLGCGTFRYMSVMVLSQPAMLFLGMVLITLWLHWWQHQRLWLAAALGAIGGLAAIVRPVEAVAYCLPIGVAMLWRMRSRRTFPFALTTIALLVSAAMPFIVLQAVHNYATTGSYTKFATDVFVERFYPAKMVGFQSFNPDFIPATPIPSFRAAIVYWVNPAYEEHQLKNLLNSWLFDRFPIFVYGTLTNVVLFSLVVVGATAAIRNGRWVLLATVPLTLLFYIFYVFYLSHYAMVVQPAIGMCVMLSAAVLSDCWPTQRHAINAAVAIAVCVAAVTGLPQSLGEKDLYPYTQLRRVNHVIDQVDKPAIVLVHFGHNAIFHQEPVYNIETIWPDDAQIVRVHDLGPSLNQKTLDYYAARQPARLVYRLEQEDASLQLLGNVADVAADNRKRLATLSNANH